MPFFRERGEILRMRAPSHALSIIIIIIIIINKQPAPATQARKISNKKSHISLYDILKIIIDWPHRKVLLKTLVRFSINSKRVCIQRRLLLIYCAAALSPRTVKSATYSLK